MNVRNEPGQSHKWRGWWRVYLSLIDASEDFEDLFFFVSLPGAHPRPRLLSSLRAGAKRKKARTVRKKGALLPHCSCLPSPPASRYHPHPPHPHPHHPHHPHPPQSCCANCHYQMVSFPFLIKKEKSLLYDNHQ